MLQEIETYLEKYPEEIVQLFMKIREVIFSSRNGRNRRTSFKKYSTGKIFKK